MDDTHPLHIPTPCKSPVSGGSGAEPPPFQRAEPAEEMAPSPPLELPPSSSLDHSETSVSDGIVDAFLREKPPAKLPPPDAVLDETSWASRFRHSGWANIRRRIFAGLRRCGVSSSRQWSFAQCGSNTWVQHCIASPDRLRLVCNHCHDRLCTPCANLRSLRLRDALLSQIDGKPVSFITLTLCGRGEGLGELVDRLYRHFRALRAHPLWDEAVNGGAAFLEIKWSDKAQRWHPHLHIIADAKYIDQGELSTAWRSITKDSYIVDIRRVREPEVTGRYVTKYASKPLNSSFCNTPKLLDEAITALKGRRLCLCFGTWYGTPLSEAEDADFADDLIDAGEWSNICTLDDVLWRAANHDEEAKRMLVALNAFEKFYIAQATPPPSPDG